LGKGGRGGNNRPSMGGVWIFSGTAKFNPILKLSLD